MDGHARFYPSSPIYGNKRDEEAQYTQDTQDQSVDRDIRKHHNMDYIYTFATEFATAWSKIFIELTSLKAIPDVVILSHIFLADDRKLFVGAFMVLMSTLYMFVFMNS